MTHINFDEKIKTWVATSGNPLQNKSTRYFFHTTGQLLLANKIVIPKSDKIANYEIAKTGIWQKINNEIDTLRKYKGANWGNLSDIQIFLFACYLHFQQEEILTAHQFRGDKEFETQKINIIQQHSDIQSKIHDQQEGATKKITAQYVHTATMQLKESKELFNINSTNDFTEVSLNKNLATNLSNLKFDFDNSLIQYLPAQKIQNIIHDLDDQDNLENKKSTPIGVIIFAGILATWSFLSVTMLYVFSGYDFLKLNKIDILHFSKHITRLNVVLLSMVSVLLLLSLITLMLSTGWGVFNKVLEIAKDPKCIINGIKKIKPLAGFGLFLSIACTIVYVLWSYFDGFALFHNRYIAFSSAIGSGLTILLFIMPAVIKALNPSDSNNTTMSTEDNMEENSNTHSHNRIIQRCIWLLIPILGELLISPIFVDSMKTDFKQSIHIKQSWLLGIVITFASLSAITMVLYTQDEKKKLLPLTKTTIPGYLLVLSTAIIGGTFSTYIGLQDLHFIRSKFLCIAWSIFASLYWVVFYYPIVKKIDNILKDLSAMDCTDSDLNDRGTNNECVVVDYNNTPQSSL